MFLQLSTCQSYFSAICKIGRKKKNPHNCFPLSLHLLTDLHLPLLEPFFPLGSLPSSWLRSPATDSTHPPFTSSWLSLSSLRPRRHPQRARHSPDLVLTVHFAPWGSSTSLHPSTTTLLNAAQLAPWDDQASQTLQFNHCFISLPHFHPDWPVVICERALRPFR